jgi:hypothetical protein
MDKIIDAEDILEQARGSAAGLMTKEDRNPSPISRAKKIDEAIALLGEYRKPRTKRAVK